MFKFTRVFLLFQLLVSTVNGADQNSLADVKSDVEALQEDLVEDLGTKRGQEMKRHPNNGKCPFGFTYLPATRSCYKAVFESHSWISAVQKCNELHCGSHLVDITSATENNAVKTFLTSELSRNAGNTACISKQWPENGIVFWTSGQRMIEDNCKSPFVWKPSSYKTLLFQFTDWLPNNPSCSWNKEFCMHLMAKDNFRWNDIACTVKICPVCEYKP